MAYKFILVSAAYMEITMLLVYEPAQVTPHRSAGGGASRAFGYTPRAVPGGSPDPLWAAWGPKGRERKCTSTQYRDRDAVDKENFVSQRAEKEPPRLAV